MGSHFELSTQLLVKTEENGQSLEPAHPCLKSLSCGSLHVVCSSVRGAISCWSTGQVFHTAHKNHSAAESFPPHRRHLLQRLPGVPKKKQIITSSQALAALAAVS